MHEVLGNRLGGLSLPRKSVVRLIDRLDMTSDVYRGRKTTATTFYLWFLFVYVVNRQCTKQRFVRQNCRLLPLRANKS